MVSVDISDVVVRQMQQKHAAAGMTFTKMDLMQLQFPDKEFTCVLDKGTLDAVFTHDDEDTAQKVETMFRVSVTAVPKSRRYERVMLSIHRLVYTRPYIPGRLISISFTIPFPHPNDVK